MAPPTDETNKGALALTFITCPPPSTTKQVLISTI